MKESRPVKFKHANDILLGGQPDVADLPILRGDGFVSSCWKLPFIRRLIVLVTGRVYLVVQSKTHPPLYIETDPLWARTDATQEALTRQENIGE